MPVNRQASGIRMLMGSITKGEEGGTEGSVDMSVTGFRDVWRDGWKSEKGRHPAVSDYPELHRRLPHDISYPDYSFLRSTTGNLVRADTAGPRGTRFQSAIRFDLRRNLSGLSGRLRR
jgi:hypothetical protein